MRFVVRCDSDQDRFSWDASWNLRICDEIGPAFYNTKKGVRTGHTGGGWWLDSRNTTILVGSVLPGPFLSPSPVQGWRVGAIKDLLNF